VTREERKYPTKTTDSRVMMVIPKAARPTLETENGPGNTDFTKIMQSFIK
jgi:hypothetical protein